MKAGKQVFDVSPSADILSASRGSSRPYTLIHLTMGLGRLFGNHLGLVMPSHAESCTLYAVDDAARFLVGPRSGVEEGYTIC